MAIPEIYRTKPSVLLTKLMHAFYAYGRMHWRWTTSSLSGAGNGRLRLNPNGWPGWQLVSAEQLKKLK